MDKTEKKEIISGWKERHPEIGVVAAKCTATEEMFLTTSRDTKNWFNRHKFELIGQKHRNKRLQELWNLYGETGFELFTVSDLKYKDSNDIKTDDLKELLDLCLQANPNSQKL
ncbi:MAG: GIY-YIG nuclease family protein [Phascolarctobacterium sp.]|nr:GIY-YIG nuclease family protein [Phascolarctobacterium sp.]